MSLSIQGSILDIAPGQPQSLKLSRLACWGVGAPPIGQGCTTAVERHAANSLISMLNWRVSLEEYHRAALPYRGKLSKF